MRRVLVIATLLVLVSAGVWFVWRKKVQRPEAERPGAPQASIPSEVPGEAPMTPIPGKLPVPPGGGEVVKKLLAQPFPENLGEASRQVEQEIRDSYKKATGSLPEVAAATLADTSPETRRQMLETCRELEKQNLEVPQRYADSLPEWKKLEATDPDEAQKSKGMLYMSLYLNRLNHEHCKGVLRK